MARPTNTVSASAFDYKRFHKDLAAKIKEAKQTFETVSTDKLYRSRSYLSNAIHDGRLTLPIILALCEQYGLSPRDYEPVKAEPVKAEPTEPVVREQGWACEVRIDEEFGTAMMRIIKDGEAIATGRSFLYGCDPVGVIQSISYAAHMCFKLAQQGKIAEIAEAPKPASYKEWLMRYEKAENVFGKLARYVKNHYKTFPASGKKDMHVYLMQNQGGDHINAFKISFDQYLDWQKRQ